MADEIVAINVPAISESLVITSFLMISFRSAFAIKSLGNLHGPYVVNTNLTVAYVFI